MKTSYTITFVIAALFIAGLADWYVFLNRGEKQTSADAVENAAMESAKNIAEAWIKEKSPTFLFDGFDLAFGEAKSGECPECFDVVFSFASRHGGYGNREGLLVTQVITQHAVIVAVENGVVTRVLTDGKYSEMTGAFIQ